MHQTFYIDIDEEITSIVDRLRKAKEREVVIVVPKRALLIQSIVNLKLLKKEAENLKKEIIIVTQDKLGKLLVEKTGMLVEQKLDDIEGEEIAMAEEWQGSVSKPSDGQTENLVRKIAVKNRWESIGSAEYFENKEIAAKHSGDQPPAESVPIEKEHMDNEKLINEELVVGIEDGIKKKKGRGLFSGKNASGKTVFYPMDMVKRMDISQKGLPEIESNDEEIGERKPKIKPKKKLFKKEKLDSEEGGDSEGEVPKNEKLEKFLHLNEDRKLAEVKRYGDQDVNLPNKFWKFFLGFGLVAALVIMVIAAYLFIPKATIKIFAKTKIQSVDAEIKGDASALAIDYEKEVVPAKLISFEEELSRDYNTTGTKTVSNQKARGMVTIYNEYTASPQPLVATTRFLSEDGKIFRLTKGVTVPGMTKVGEELKPGAIEAEVVADEAGTAFNIGPTTFTIPGFKSSGAEKYSKFYARSFKPMTGGGDGSENVRVISGEDVSGAKNKVTEELNQIMKQKIKESAGEGVIIPEDAVSIGDPDYFLSNSVGEAVEKFTITVKTRVVAIVFNESDLKSVVEKEISKAVGGENEIIADSLKLGFGKSDADFAKKTIIIRVNAVGKTHPTLNLDNLKKEAAGKTEEELVAYLKSYSAIERAEIDYWPSFISGKIPAYQKRIEVILDNN